MAFVLLQIWSGCWFFAASQLSVVVVLGQAICDLDASIFIGAVAFGIPIDPLCRLQIASRVLLLLVG